MILEQISKCLLCLFFVCLWLPRCIFSRITFCQPQKIRAAPVASLHCTNPAPETLQLTLYKPQTNMGATKPRGMGLLCVDSTGRLKTACLKISNPKATVPSTPLQTIMCVSWTQKWRKLDFLLATMCWCSNKCKRSFEHLKKSNSD